MMTSFVYFGGAEGDRTPDPKTASRNGQKNTILALSPGFPFITMNQGLVGFTMILSVTMILPVRIRFSTILAQWVEGTTSRSTAILVDYGSGSGSNL
jgi:hypothetical protein